MVPVDEQGASSSTASNSSPDCQPAASASTSSACKSSRARFSASNESRVFELSTATTEAPASTSCAVLPPGAAQISATPLPATSPSSLAGSDAATSCTHQAPSAKP